MGLRYRALKKHRIYSRPCDGTMMRDCGDLAPSVLYGEILELYCHFNKWLFGAGLPSVAIELTTCPRSSFCVIKPKNAARGSHEWTLVITGDQIVNGNLPLICAELVHEMTHLWQLAQGLVGRREYHNRSWANRMESMGLMPSATGMEGGLRTGYHVSQYVLAGGQFATAVEKLRTEGFQFSLITAKQSYAHSFSDAVAEPPCNIGCEDPANILLLIEERRRQVQGCNRSLRYVYICPGCRMRMWGRLGARIQCNRCNEQLWNVTGISKAEVERFRESYMKVNRMPHRMPLG